MSDRSGFHIIHVLVPQRGSLFLHELSSTSQLPTRLRGEQLSAFYASEPDPRELANFRKGLHWSIVESVKKERADRDFPFRFAASAAVFLASFFVLTMVFRGTLLPLKLPVSVVAATFFYMTLLRRSFASEQVRSDAEFLRNKIDSVVFQESEFLHAVEALLARLNPLPLGQMIEYAMISDAMLPDGGELEDALCLILEAKRKHLVSDRIYRKIRRGKVPQEAILERIKNQYERDGLDRTLFALGLCLHVRRDYSGTTCSSSRIDSSSR